MKSNVSGCASGLVGVLLLTAAVACQSLDERPSREPGRPLAPPQTAPAGDTPLTRMQFEPEDVRVGETPPVQEAEAPMVSGWTETSSELAPRCASDSRGNWVCVWPAGEYGGGGPCVFGPDETIDVASQTWTPDNRAVVAQLSQFDLEAHPLWSRSRTRSGALATLTLSINALAYDSLGVLHAGGEACNLEAPGPRADPGYYNSCIDAHWVTLDAHGTVLAERTFGTSGGLERISDLGAAPEGMYLVGSYHPPWLLGGQRLGDEATRANQFLARRDHAGNVLWWRSFGSAEHDGNDLRLAVTRDGGVAVTGHLGLAPAGPGFVAHFDERGAERWTYTDARIYIARLASDEEGGFYIGSGMLHLDAGGAARALPTSEATTLRRVVSTERETLVSASDDGHRVVETDTQGRVLRALSIDGAHSLWYRGGLCAGSDRIAISSTIDSDSDFGILEQPLEIREPMAFLLVLKEW